MVLRNNDDDGGCGRCHHGDAGKVKGPRRRVPEDYGVEGLQDKSRIVYHVGRHGIWVKKIERIRNSANPWYENQCILA